MSHTRLSVLFLITALTTWKLHYLSVHKRKESSVLNFHMPSTPSCTIDSGQIWLHVCSILPLAVSNQLPFTVILCINILVTPQSVPPRGARRASEEGVWLVWETRRLSAAAECTGHLVWVRWKDWDTHTPVKLFQLEARTKALGSGGMTSLWVSFDSTMENRLEFDFRNVVDPLERM